MSSNATCFQKHSAKEPPPLVQNGKLVIQAHHIGWIITGAFTFFATAISLWLVNKHLKHYTNKHEQRYIVRILFMVPIYSLVSFASYLFWDHSTPLLLIRDCYESTVLTSFFYLLLLYLSPNADEQRAIFLKVGLSKENDRQAIQRGEPVKKWIFPLRSIKSKPVDGLYFLQIMKWGVLQYCVIRPLTTLVAVILDYVGLYCEDSWSPGWGHVYITVIVSISVTVAMYCLIQVYVPISSQLAPHRSLLKLFAIKAVVFLTFWQATFLSVLSSLGVVKDTEYMTADDINIGIGAIVETVEMTMFALLHIKAFSYKPYLQSSRNGPFGPNNLTNAQGYEHDDVPHTPRLRSLLHAFDFRETLKELSEGCIYIVRRWKGIENDATARRLVIREDLYGAESRPKGKASSEPRRLTSHREAEGYKKYLPVATTIDIEVESHVDSKRQRIGTGGDYIYDPGFSRCERSAGLAEQIEIELDRRGLPRGYPGSVNVVPSGEGCTTHDRRQRSWWRKTFDRVSSSSLDDDGPGRVSRAQEGTEKEALKKVIKICNPLPVAEEVDETEGLASASHRSAEKIHHQSRLPTVVVSPVSGNTPINTNNLSSADPRTSNDAVLARLFAGKPRSEASGPSSQTHLSSRGHHIRLTAPAAVVPSGQQCTFERRPELVSATNCPPKPESHLRTHSRLVPESSARGGQRRSLKRHTAIKGASTTGRSRHHRERAYYEHFPPGTSFDPGEQMCQVEDGSRVYQTHSASRHSMDMHRSPTRCPTEFVQTGQLSGLPLDALPSPFADLRS